MREIDAETRIAPARILARLASIDERDPIARAVFCKTARRGEPGVTRAHDDPVRCDVAAEWRLRRSGFKDSAPAIAVIVDRQMRDAHEAGQCQSTGWMA